MQHKTLFIPNLNSAQTPRTRLRTKLKKSGKNWHTTGTQLEHSWNTTGTRLEQDWNKTGTKLEQNLHRKCTFFLIDDVIIFWKDGLYIWNQ